MQPSARTPSSILRKRQSQEEQNRRKSLRAKGRRVSFAPDDELETRHLFSIDKASPAVPSQDTQPLGELQNQMHAPGSHDPAAAAAGGSGKWGVHDKHGHHAGQTDQDLLVRHQHNSLQQPEAYLLSPEAAGTPQSMDLTNDTLQNPGAIGSFPGFSLRDENDSMELGGGDLQGAGCFFAGRDGTYNITGDVPKLSALLEEDEEGDEARGTCSGDEEAESEGVAMELTGNTMHTPGAAAGAAGAATPAGGAPAAGQDETPRLASPRSRRRSRGSSAAAAAAAGAEAAATPAASPAAVSPAPRRSTRRSSAAQDATPPGAAAAASPAASTPAVSPARSTPRGRGGRRSSTTAAGSDGEGVVAAAAGARQHRPEQDGTTPQPSPRRGRSSTGAGAAAAAAHVPGSALKGHHAPSLDPTPSPLRRITRSMASPLASPVLSVAGFDDASGSSGGGGGAFDGLTEGFTERLLAGDIGGVAVAGGNGGAAGAGSGGRGSRRSSINRFAEQQNRWGFVPGEEDTLNINMNVPGAGGLGDTTLHHVYSDSTGTGELTASMKPGQHPAAAAAAAAGPGLRAGSRRRSSVGRGRAWASLAAETIPEETLTPQPPAAAAPTGASAQPEVEFSTGTGGASPQQQGDTAAVTPARGAGASAAREAAEGELTQDMDMDISLNLGGATPGLLGDSHLTPLVQQGGGWRHAQQTPLQQQLSQFSEVVLESPFEGGGAAANSPPQDGGAADLMDVDDEFQQADENAPPAAASTPGGVGAAGSPADAAAAAAGGGEVDGLTTNLLLDDHRQLAGWGHVPLGARASLGGAGGGLTTHTGRGSVGSNVLTMHTHRFGQTTQLLADSASKDVRGADRLPAAAAAAPRHSTTPGAVDPAGGGYDDCTTKLLADSTSASACGIMGILPQQPRVGLLHSSTIAGGAPVLHPTAGPFGRQQQQQEQEQLSQGEEQELEAETEEEGGDQGLLGAADQKGFYQSSPELQGAQAAAGSTTPWRADADMQECEDAAAAAAAAGAAVNSPADHWAQTSSQTPARTPAAPAVSPARLTRSAAKAAAAAAGQSPELLLLRPSPLGAATAAAAGGGRGGSREADEPTLELAGAGAAAGVSGLAGQSLLEDATLEDFALPPDMMGGAEERPITMPFSGALPAAPGPVPHTPGGSVLRTAQPITFSDFCQIVDMQFLTHIRRGTSISVCDFAPSSLPLDLSKALELLSVTSCEVSVLEAAMHDLQAEMHAKRREAYEQEDRLGCENPAVFGTVQTSRPTQLEQTKHCLVLHKKACRSQTASSWKALRVQMEQQLADKLAQQQADLDEQLAFVQAKLQKAQQQREYAKAFHADVLKRMVAEDIAQQEASAARARLVCLRNRLAELRGLNADRQQRAAELQERVAETEAKRAELGSELSVLRSRREQLSSVVASTPKPAASQKVLTRLQQASEHLQLLQSLQGCKLLGDAAGGYLLSFGGLLAVSLTVQDQAAAATEGGSSSAAAGNSSQVVCGSLVLLPREAGAAAAAGVPAEGALKLQLLQDLVSVLQPRCSFACAPALVREACTETEAVASRALELADACQEVFLAQPLLTGVSVRQGAAAEPDAMDVDGVVDQEQESQGLVLTLVEPDTRVKVEVVLRLRDLLAHAHPGTRDRVVAASVQVLLAPKGAAAGGPQAQLQAIVSKAVEGPYLLSDGSIETTQDALLRCVCESVVKGIRGG